MLSKYSTVVDTPEIQRIKTTQQNISNVSSCCAEVLGLDKVQLFSDSGVFVLYKKLKWG